MDELGAALERPEMNHEKLDRKDIDQVAAFLQAGRHLTPSGEAVTLNKFRLAFLQSGLAPRGFPTMRVLKDYFPAHEKAMRAASLAKVAATGRITLPG